MVNAESKTATETCNRDLDVKLGVKKVCQNFISNFTKQYSWLINFDYKIMVTGFSSTLVEIGQFNLISECSSWLNWTTNLLIQVMRLTKPTLGQSQIIQSSGTDLEK